MRLQAPVEDEEGRRVATGTFVRRAAGALWTQALAAVSGLHLADHAAATDGAGNLLLAGHRVVERGAPAELGVVKLSPGGEVLWARVVADTEGSSRWSIAADPEGGCFLAGAAHGTKVVLKIGPRGERGWIRGLDRGPEPWPPAVAADAEGNLVVFGDDARGSLVLRKLDPAGTLVAERRFACHGSARRPRVAIDPEGSAFVAGYFDGVLAFGGGWQEAKARLTFGQSSDQGVRVWECRLTIGMPLLRRREWRHP